MTARNAFAGLALEEGHLAAIAAAAAQAATDASVQAVLAQLTAMENPSGTALTISGTRDRFRDGFTTGTAAQPVDPAVWTLVNDAPDTGDGRGHLVLPGGDSQGAAYLRVSLSPFVCGSAVTLASKQAFTVPIRHAWGVSMSQRFSGQEVLFGLAEQATIDPQANPLGLNLTAQPADLPITGSLVTNGTVMTVTVPGHGLKGNDRVVLFGNAKKELNLGPVYVTVVDANNFTVPTSFAAGSYTGGGVVRVLDPSANIANCALQLWGDTTTASNATYAARRNGTKTRFLNNQGSVSSSPTAPNSSPYSDPWLAQGPSEIWANIDEVVWRGWIDGNGGTQGYQKFQQSIPDETSSYRLFARARNLENLSRPVARIVSAVKAASSTATITTDVPHGLAVGDNVAVLGIRDQTNFGASGNLTVGTVPTATTFTVTFGTSTTITDTNGGVVWLDHGGINFPGHIGQTVQNITKSGSIISLAGTATWSGISPGDYVQLYGLLPGFQTWEGAYKVLRINGVTLELACNPALPDRATANTGGEIIRRTDVRLHFARILAHTRVMSEIIGGRGGTSDANNAVPVSVSNFGPTIAATATPNTTFGSTEPITSTNLGVSGVYTQPGVSTTSLGANQRPARARLIVMHTAGVVPGLLAVQQSSDNATWRTTWQVPVPSDGLYHTFDVPVHLSYYRLVFTNGVTAQTAFWLSSITFRGEGEVPEDVGKILTFPLTAAAGQQVAAAGNLVGPSLDLGGNHRWDTARAIFTSDQASATGGADLQQSFDGATWFTTTSLTFTPAVAGTAEARTLEDKIVARYVRFAYYNGATVTGATAFRAALALKSL